MLVLSRKERQRIRLGDSIVITIVRLSGDRVRLGIEAPDDLIVLREELEEAATPPFQESKEKATESPHNNPTQPLREVA